MSQNELINKIEALREYEVLATEVAAEIESIKDSIKKELDRRGVEDLQVGNYIVKFTTVLSNRFDSTAFKKQYNELYKAFTKTSLSRRFTISA